MDGDRDRVLDGVCLLDLTRLLPGPYATLLLADLGAEVIKVEDPQGDPLRLMPPFLPQGLSARFAALNRGKRSVVLDLKAPEGRRAFLKLAEAAGVVIEGFRPGVVQRLGVDYESVRRVRPDIIYCSLTGYGQDGPYHRRVGHDLNYIGVAGLLRMTGFREPVIPGVPMADLAGGMFAALAILAALLGRGRQRTEGGQFLDVSMTDAVVSWMTLHAAEAFATGQSPKPEEMPLTGGYPFYNVYETQDGKYLTVGCLEPKFWANLCRALGLEAYIPHQFAGGERRRRIFRALRETFKSKPLAEWLTDLADHDIPVAPVHDIREALTDPQVRARGLQRDGGIAFPVRFGDRRPGADTADTSDTSAAPALGQHTAALLRRVGYSQGEIEDLARRGVIRIGPSEGSRLR